MLFIVNRNIPAEAYKKLLGYGNVIPFSSSGLSYPEVSDHADIFLCSSGKKIIYAPNTPPPVLTEMMVNGVTCVPGYSDAGATYPSSARYNAVVTENFVIHNKDAADLKIIEENPSKRFIHIRQGYTRCSLLPLKEDNFITSDAGIYKALKKEGLNCLLTDSSDIILPGMRHGFFGGACGITDDRVFLIGSLDKHRDGGKVKEFIEALGYEIIELYDGKLFDAGSIITVKN